MTCPEIKILLPGHLEGVLSPEEKETIESHLASCPLCRRILEELKETEYLVKGLNEVEPPPFFEQRIMAMIREEAGQKKGILRKYFYPLHIKIPIQALTTVLVAVLAFYVFQKHEPEMRQITPLASPLTEPDKGRITDESPKAPLASSVAKPTAPSPAANFPAKDHGQFAVPPPIESKRRADRKAELPPPKQEEYLSTIKRGAPITAEREKEVPPPGAQALGKAQDRAEKQDSGKALDTLGTGQKLKGRMTEPGVTAGESRAMKSAPVASRFAAAPAIKRFAVDLTIQVRDTNHAVKEIEDRLAQVNGRVIERRHQEGRVFLKAEITGQTIAGFLDRLATVGKITSDQNPLDYPEGQVTVNIKIVTSP
jgi:hypothetical protein